MCVYIYYNTYFISRKTEKVTFYERLISESGDAQFQSQGSQSNIHGALRGNETGFAMCVSGDFVLSIIPPILHVYVRSSTTGTIDLFTQGLRL